MDILIVLLVAVVLLVNIALFLKFKKEPENDNKDEYGLFIGPTLKKEDSFNVVEELKNIRGFNPEVQKYD